MIITPERLLDLARDRVASRSTSDRLLCAFVTGSTARQDPLLGGVTDVDTVIVHRDHPLRDRELVRLSSDVHLELFHYAHEELPAPRQLRLDPLLGPAIASGVAVYDPEHLFEWLQAGVRAHYTRPDQRLARSRAQLQQARSTRRSLAQSSAAGWPQQIASSAFAAAHAAASLTGEPTRGRRALLELRRELIEHEQTALFADFLELLGLTSPATWDLPQWLSGWAKAYDSALQRGGDPIRSETRRDYFLRGFQALADADEPQAAAFGLLTTWPLDAINGDGQMEPADAAWQALLQSLGFDTPEPEAKAEALENYLDDVEIYLQSWGETYGA